MSYASVTAHSAPPPSQQPQQDQVFLDTTPPTSHGIADGTAKVNIVSPNLMNDPTTLTSETIVVVDHDDNISGSLDKKTQKKNANKRLQDAEIEGLHLWEVTKHYLFRPGVAGGLIGLINVGLLAGAGRKFYTQPHLRSDATSISSTVAATVALLSAEGYAAEKYRKSSRGQEEERRANEEGILIYQYLHKQILRPRILGGMVGLVNAVILGAVGYLSYINWDKPSWNRRTVSAVSLGLITLWSGEGFLAKHFRKEKC